MENAELEAELKKLSERVDQLQAEISNDLASIDNLIHEAKNPADIAECSKGTFIAGQNNAVYFRANNNTDLAPGEIILEFEQGILKVGNYNQVFYSPK